MKKHRTVFNYFNKLSLIVLCFILYNITFVPAQAFEIKKQYSTSKKILTSEEVSTQLALADKYKRSNPTKFKQLIFELAQQKTLTTEQRHYLNLLHSYHLSFIGEYDSAESKIKEILHSDASSLIKFRANYALITISMTTQNWLNGLQYVTKNINALASINNSEHYQNGLLITIIFYNQIGQYTLALSYIEQLAKQDLSAKNDCWLRQLTLETKFKLNELKSGNPALEDTIQKCITADNKINTNIVRTYKAKLFLQENMPEAAINFMLGSLDEVRSTQYPMLIAETANIIAKAYWQINDIDNAQLYASEALTINNNMSNLLQGVDTYYLLYQVTKQQQNLALALDYFEKYAEVERNQLEGEKAKHLAFQIAQHQSLEQKSQIKLLNKKNALLVSEKALAKAKVANVQMFIAILTVTIALLVLWGGRLLQSHRQVKELAEYDALTGIYNRGHFTQVTKSALKYCKNAQQDLSVIMFDLDHFKLVNDNYGHACGDWALKATIKVCQDIGRQNDIFARLGGEEFCLVLPSCSIEVAQLRAEACRAAIEEIITEESGCDFSITASFGVTDVKRSGFDLDKLLADSDGAAYASKHAGRNRVTVFQPAATDETKPLDNSWSVVS
ncbi:GGDEF domain-containing protein [Colwellia psychrerythraea]|uniref:diguanylate cyclase n=1 Tax=Colwellia psychrerythraea TaxID=28229 RepID=A0A099KI93_COLPS|nr:GGDEF domain-containing protein [Colwellia psychrerythraea]KGJ89697.1 diguanylate cyclase [Colwellia psychrerythraea]